MHFDRSGSWSIFGHGNRTPGTCQSPEARATKTIKSFAHGTNGGGDRPAGSVDVDAVVAVPGPGFGDQHEAGAGVAEAILQQLAGVAGDEVGGGGRVAVVHDADRPGALAFGEIVERGVEVVEAAAVIHKVGADHREVCRGCGVEAGRGRVRHRQVFGDSGKRLRDNGEEGCAVGSEGRRSAQAVRVEAASRGHGMHDEQDRREGCGGQQRRFGKGRHGVRWWFERQIRRFWLRQNDDNG